jgi:hypothetical protein
MGECSMRSIRAVTAAEVDIRCAGHAVNTSVQAFVAPSMALKVHRNEYRPLPLSWRD